MTFEAGLPEIWGNFGFESLVVGDVGTPKVDGAFHYDPKTDRSRGHVKSGIDPLNDLIDFKASRCSTIYGNSTTVQPTSVTVNYFIRSR